MVKDTGAPAGPGALHPLNAPQLLRVKMDERGRPQRLSIRRKELVVASIEDHWRIEDEWWRNEGVARSYFEVLTEDGRRLTLFYDELTGDWYEQRYG